MKNCPVCGMEFHSLTCACGYDRSKDYKDYPVLAPLPSDQTNAAIRIDHKQAARQATVTCPECKKETVLQEQTRDHRYRNPTCPNCSKSVLLDPTDRFNAYAEVFMMCLSARKPWGMYDCANKCMSVFQYGNPEMAHRLADTLSSIVEDPANHGLDLRDDLQEVFVNYADRARKMVEERNIGRCIFDE